MWGNKIRLYYINARCQKSKSFSLGCLYFPVILSIVLQMSVLGLCIDYSALVKICGWASYNILIIHVWFVLWTVREQL